MGKPLQPIPEVMRRTLQNLYAIHQLREQRQQQGIDVDSEGPFEVTQLVNSFLGALAHPWEALLKNRDPTDFPQLARLSRHLANAQTIEGNAPNLIDQLGYIRNAFSHGNVELLADQKVGGIQEISSIRLWNCRRRNGQEKKNWEIRFRVDELVSLLEDFSSAADELYDERLIRRREDCEFDDSVAISAQSSNSGPYPRNGALGS
jgi:hypothetical protein